MTWHLQPMMCLDFETSGTDQFRDRIVTAAAIQVEAGCHPVTRDWLINPGIDIPAGATAVHGITTQQAQAEGVAPAGAVRDIATVVLHATSRGIPIVGHNLGSYDLTMLWAELTRHGHDDLAADLLRVRPVIDTFVIEKHLDPFRPAKPNGKRPDSACGSHQLVDTCRLWDIRLSEQDAHGAAADALAAGRLAWRLATQPDRFAQFDARPQTRINLAAMPLDQLHDWQVEEKRRQADSFGKYLVRQGKPDDVSREWPIQSPPAGWTPEQLPEPREADAA